MGISRKMHNFMKKTGLSLAALGLIVSFQNCAEQKFSSGGGGSANSVGGPVNLGNSDDDASGVLTQTGGPNCRDELKALTTPVRMVFVVDVSGSNSGNNGTDPQKAVRAGSIQRFYNSYAAKSNFSWTFITFANSSANTLIANANSAAMQGAINNFNGINDNGNTPYVAALDKTEESIVNDSARPVGVKYIVVFFSDGMPNPSVNNSVLSAGVTDIKKASGLANDPVSFNTVYYGQNNQGAHDRLQMMAQVGGGNFLDTNVNPTGNAFLISDLVIVPGVVCQ